MNDLEYRRKLQAEYRRYTKIASSITGRHITVSNVESTQADAIGYTYGNEIHIAEWNNIHEKIYDALYGKPENYVPDAEYQRGRNRLKPEAQAEYDKMVTMFNLQKHRCCDIKNLEKAVIMSLCVRGQPWQN